VKHQRNSMKTHKMTLLLKIGNHKIMSIKTISQIYLIQLVIKKNKNNNLNKMIMKILILHL
jgi:hypothetical protein